MGMLKSGIIHPSYQTASGLVPYNLMNDYMFHVVLQENEHVLRGLIAALLHLDQNEIKSVTVTNPIKPGEKIDNKVFILDIHVLMNNDTSINLEMQVVKQRFWHENMASVDDDFHRGFSSAQESANPRIRKIPVSQQVAERRGMQKVIRPEVVKNNLSEGKPEHNLARLQRGLFIP